MRQVWEVVDFIRSARARLRFGALSRAPLQILRLEWKRVSVELDWLARSADPWDRDIGSCTQARHASAQALEDALNVRALLLGSFPDVKCAKLRVFRLASHGPPELIILGTVSPEPQLRWEVSSLAMRAKLSGFQFSLEDGVLATLQDEEWATSSS